MNFNHLEQQMKTMYQIEGKQTIWEHGKDVKETLNQIISQFKTGKGCFLDNEISHLKPLMPFLYEKDTLDRYALYHDIGKTLVRTKDDCG